MNLRWVLPMLCVPLLVACGGEGESGGSSASAASSTSSGGGDGAKWRVVYSGDLNGEVSGGIMSVAGFGTNTILVGAAMNEGSTGAADQSIRATITRYGEGPTTPFSLKLADGIRCFDVTEADPIASSVDIIDAEKDTFRAEITGTMHCGPEKDQRIDFTAFINADP